MQQRQFLSIITMISFTLLLIITLLISSSEFIKAHGQDSLKNHDKNLYDSKTYARDTLLRLFLV